MTATYFSLFELVGIEAMRAVKEEGSANVNYAIVNGSITSGSLDVARQKNAFRLRLTDSVVQPISGWLDCFINQCCWS